MSLGAIGGFLGGLGSLAGGLGGLFGGSSGPSMAPYKKGIQWRVADAEAAGVHPLYALGAPVMSPVANDIRDIPGDLERVGRGAGDALRALGQDTDRAEQAQRTSEERSFVIASRTLELERLGLQNDLLRSQIARNNSAQLPPAFPNNATSYNIPGQPDSRTTAAPIPLVEPKPMEITMAAPGRPSNEPGAVPEVGYARTATGWAVVPSQDVKNRIEDQFFPEIGWMIRNNIAPAFSPERYNPPFPAPDGLRWSFNAVLGEYRLVDSDGKVHPVDALKGWWKRFTNDPIGLNRVQRRAN